MKHTAVAVAAIVVVAIYSIFTFFYVSDFTKELENKITASDNNTVQENIIDMRTVFDDRKNILNFIINKEHLNELENNLSCLETSVLHNDAQNVDMYLVLLSNSVAEIKHHNKCIL